MCASISLFFFSHSFLYPSLFLSFLKCYSSFSLTSAHVLCRSFVSLSSSSSVCASTHTKRETHTHTHTHTQIHTHTHTHKLYFTPVLPSSQPGIETEVSLATALAQSWRSAEHTSALQS